jgi:Fe-Mn family superoxide dismutase
LSETNQNKSLIDGIKKDLGLKDSNVVEEAYVAIPKKYNLNTEFLSPKSKKSHFTLYDKYTKALSRISSELDSVDRDEINSNHSEFRSLKKDEVFNQNAVYLHELHFANISDVNSMITQDSLSFMRLTRDFGSFDAWQSDFIATAMSARNGWAVCAYSTYLQKFVNFVVDSHDAGVMLGCYPVIVLDMWEHAYYTDYQTDKKTYIYAMMKEFNWNIIEERIKRADKIAQALK